ncbi:hypothetical protein PsorP6_011663 [Peronosclerospora sorghi]|uniref:Uncharacterized protein n=1 Tax=Peronosclerospora sorghi TaxID=230839 RepID=A0ACC0WJ32_9STRA|nr:hypothetical protein PsorP6_011663 [Peronosclerospora sorghi]
MRPKIFIYLCVLHLTRRSIEKRGFAAAVPEYGYHYKDNTDVHLLLDSGTVDGPMEAVAAKVNVGDDSTAPPSPTAAGANVDLQPRLVDVEVDSSAPTTETAAAANVDRPLRLVYVIHKASALRRVTSASTAK